MPTNNNKPANSAWAGYAYAIAVTAAVYVLRSGVGRLTGNRISLPLCGLAAVIACAWRAGIGPALAVVAFTTAWYVWDFHSLGAASLQASGAGGSQAWIHYVIYVTEAGVVCFYGRQLRVARDRAARGEYWQRNLVETAGEGIWMVDPRGAIGYANPRIAEILGCAVNQIEGRKFEDFLFPEDLPAERIRFQNRRAGVKEQFDRRLRRADGSEVWTLACSSPYAYRGEDAGILTMMTDITERKKAEQSLRHSERKFRELFENIREGVYQTSTDGRILAANPELLRMLGFSSQEELNVAGVVRDTFVDPSLHQSLRDRLESDGSYANVEFQLRTRDQRIVTVRENARVVRDENGNVLYYEGSLTDITETIRFEKQLRKAQQMEALGRLAGGIARDFRRIGVGMLNGLQQALEILPADSLARPRLEAVARSMQSAAALTRQILDFSQRQVNGREGYRADDAVIDVNALVVRLEAALVRLASPENSLAVLLCQGPAPVFADPDHIRQIVTSFVIHAREFGAGVKKIVLRTAIEASGPAETAGPFVSLSVASQAAPGREAVDSGAVEELHPWIGMATNQALLAQYGGTMTASVEPPTAEFGRGVRYSLYLPLATGTNLAQTTDEAAGRVLSGAGVAAVLLLEEEPLIRELSRDMLERQGFRVLTAGSASEAERIARGEETFDVLITSWVTDGERGTALVRLLREMRPELRVLFVAGYSGVSGEDSIPALEGTAILQRPFSGDSLGRAVRVLLAKTQAAETL